MNGDSLAFQLERIKQFPETHVKFYSAQIICGLSYLHEKGLIYE